MASGTTKLALLGSAVVGGALLAYGLLAPRAMENGINAWLAANPSIHVGKVTTSAWARRIELDGVSHQEGSTGFTATQMVVTCPLDQLPTAVMSSWKNFAADARITNATLTVGAVLISAPSVEIDGAAYDDGKASDPAALIAAISANDIIVPNMSVHAGMVGIGSSGNIAALQATNIVHGKIGTLGITGLHMQVSGLVHETVTADQMSETNIDLPAYYRFLSQSGDSSMPLARIMDGSEGDNMVVDVAGPTKLHISIAKFTAGPLDARPMKIPYFTLMQRLKSDPTHASAMLSDIFRAVHYTSLDLDDIQSTGTTRNQQNFTFGLRHMGIKEFGAGKFGDMLFEGLSMDGSAFHFGLDKFDLGGVDFNPTITALQNAALGPQALAATSNPAEHALNMEPTIAHLEIDGMSVKKPDGTVPYALGGFTIDSSNYVHGMPSHSAMKLTDLLFSVPTNNAGALVLSDMGYGQLDVSAALTLDWNQTQGDITLSDASFGLKNMGSVGLNASLHNITRDRMLAKDFSAASFSAADIKLADQGLVNKALDYMARRTGQDHAAALATVTVAMNASLTRLLGATPVEQNTAAAIEKFLQNPQSLEFNANPTPPLALTDWKNADWTAKADQ